MILLMYS